MSDYEFELPYPPSINGYWRSFRGRQIISKRGREYRVNAIAAIAELGLCGELVSERLHMTIELHPPTLRKYDVDNFAKGALDALTHAKFWLDDEQVDSLTVKKCGKVKGGFILVKINKQ